MRSLHFAKIYLYTGIISYLVAVLCIVLNLGSLSFQIWVLPGLVSVTLVTHLFFFLSYARKPVFNIEHLFFRIIGTGILVFLVIFIPDICMRTGIRLKLPPIALSFINLISVYLILLYFLMCLSMFRKLIFDRRTDEVNRQWWMYITVLAFSSLAGFLFPKGDEYVTSIAVLTGLVIMMPLLIRLKWIALRSGKIKWMVIASLFIIVVISTGMAFKLFSLHAPAFIDARVSKNVFFLLLIALVIGYSAMSLLTILFNLPISSVIQDQNTEIRSFQEMSSALINKESKEETLKRLFQTCYKNTGSSAGWLMLNTNGLANTKHTSNISSDEIQLINRRINFKKISTEEPSTGYHYFPDLVKSKVYRTTETPFKSLLVLPIYENSHLQGAIFLIKSYEEGFDEYMIDSTKSYINQVKLAFENASLIQETIESERYKKELNIARDVQQALMPAEFPENEFCEIAAYNESAKEVGGDYYDYNLIDEYQLAIIVGDVSGKGASAAFHMAQMKGIFQALIQLCLPPDNFLVMANNAIKHCFEKERFITIIYLMFDFAFGKVTFSRAGHSPLLYYNAKEETVKYIQGKGLGLGILRNNMYASHVKAHELRLNEEDVLVLYTDGIIESRRNNSEEEYNYSRLKNCLTQNVEGSAEEIKQAILSDFKAFTKGSDFKDDTTLLVIKIKKVSG